MISVDLRMALATLGEVTASLRNREDRTPRGRGVCASLVGVRVQLFFVLIVQSKGKCVSWLLIVEVVLMLSRRRL